jgi:hypothetical protein
MEGWPVPVAELQFAPPRRWRFDLAWPDYKVAVEIQGGLFAGGAHTQGMWLRREYEKVNTAQLAGWRVLFIEPADIKNGHLSTWLARIFGHPAAREPITVVE